MNLDKKEIRPQIQLSNQFPYLGRGDLMLLAQL